MSIQNVQEWGNKRAAEYYEYHLPDGFRRPQGDSSLEQFIRNKYEKKLYINKAGPPPARATINSPEKVCTFVCELLQSISAEFT